VFDIGFSELMVIGVVALVVIGPERLPRVARTAGHLLGRFQRYVAQVKADINQEMELSELRNLQTTVEDAARSFEASVKSEVQSAEDELRKAEDELKKAEDEVKQAAAVAFPNPHLGTQQVDAADSAHATTAELPPGLASAAPGTGPLATESAQGETGNEPRPQLELELEQGKQPAPRQPG
jgi:sec-independent protein translocase protein TatB